MRKKFAGQGCWSCLWRTKNATSSKARRFLPRAMPQAVTFLSLSRGAGGTRVVIVLAEQAEAPVGLRLVQRYRFTYIGVVD